MEMGEKERPQIQYSRVLPSRTGVFRKFKDSSGEGLVRDGSFLPFLIEELVALGVIDIAIPMTSADSLFIHLLPASLRRRVVLVDKGLRSVKDLQAIFTPIAEEFQIEPKGLALTLQAKLSEDLQRAIGTLYLSLYDFLVGLENELQIDIDLPSTRASIATVRRSSRNPNSRANLAILSGILESYQLRTPDSLVLRSSAPDRLVSVFQEFIQDETYRLLSTQTHSLGFPAHLQRSLIILGRLAKQIAAKERFRQLVCVGSRVIAAATHVPVPDDETFAHLVRKGYLPPIVSLDKAFQKAKEAWKSAAPDLVVPEGFRGKVIDSGKKKTKE
jgi:hypothetical protein